MEHICWKNDNGRMVSVTRTSLLSENNDVAQKLLSTDPLPASHRPVVKYNPTTTQIERSVKTFKPLTDRLEYTRNVVTMARILHPLLSEHIDRVFLYQYQWMSDINTNPDYIMSNLGVLSMYRDVRGYLSNFDCIQHLHVDLRPIDLYLGLSSTLDSMYQYAREDSCGVLKSLFDTAKTAVLSVINRESTIPESEIMYMTATRILIEMYMCNLDRTMIRYRQVPLAYFRCGVDILILYRRFRALDEADLCKDILAIISKLSGNKQRSQCEEKTSCLGLYSKPNSKFKTGKVKGERAILRKSRIYYTREYSDVFTRAFDLPKVTDHSEIFLNMSDCLDTQIGFPDINRNVIDPQVAYWCNHIISEKVWHTVLLDYASWKSNRTVQESLLVIPNILQTWISADTSIGKSIVYEIANEILEPGFMASEWPHRFSWLWSLPILLRMLTQEQMDLLRSKWRNVKSGFNILTNDEVDYVKALLA